MEPRLRGAEVCTDLVNQGSCLPPAWDLAGATGHLQHPEKIEPCNVLEADKNPKSRNARRRKSPGGGSEGSSSPSPGSPLLLER